MKKILNSFFLLFLLTILEYGSFYLGILKSFNSFLLILIWFRYLYRIYGFTELETKLRDKYPIKFKFNPLYLFKLFKRAIKIKFIIIKLIITNVKNKRISIKSFSFLIFIIGITLVLFRYLRGCLLVEVIEVLNLDKKLAEILVIGGIIIGCVLELIYKSISPSYAIVIIGDQTYSNSEESLSNLTSMMKRAGTQVKERLGSLRRNYSNSSGIKKLEELSTNELQEKVFIFDRFEVLKWLVDKASKTAHLFTEMGEYRRTAQGYKNFDYVDTDYIEEFLQLKTTDEKLKFLQKDPHEVAQQIRLPIIHHNGIIKKNPDMARAFYTIQKKINNPVKIDKALEAAHEFQNNFRNDVLNHPVVRDYFQISSKNDFEFYNVIYEIPLIPWVRGFLNDDSILLGLQTNQQWGEPDALNLLNNQYKTIQLKIRTGYRNANLAYNDFTDKYFKTDICVLLVENHILIQEKIFSNNFKDLTIRETSIPCTPELFENLESFAITTQNLNVEQKSFVSSIARNVKRIIKNISKNPYIYEDFKLISPVQKILKENVIEEMETKFKLNGTINTNTNSNIDTSPCIKPSQLNSSKKKYIK